MMDLHCHLDLFPHAISLLPEVNNRNAFTLAVTTSPRAWQASSRVMAKYTRIAVGLGFHPELIADRIGEMPFMIRALEQVKYVGEIGLDGTPRNKATLPIQTEALCSIIRNCGKQRTHVMSIHSRAAVGQVLSILERRNVSAIPILHWFTGSQRELNRAMDLGCWFSVNPSMLVHSGSKRLVTQMPLDRILPETDGPFAEIDGKILMPWEAMNICETLGALHCLSIKDVEVVLRRNVETIVRL